MKHVYYYVRKCAYTTRMPNREYHSPCPEIREQEVNGLIGWLRAHVVQSA